MPLYRGTIDYSPTRLTSTNISFLPRCLSKVICAVGETPPYPHVCFIGSDRIIPLVHIINHSLLSPCRKHLFFCFECHFYSWVSFSCSKKWRKIWRTQNMKRYFEKNNTCTSFRLHDRALEQYIYSLCSQGADCQLLVFWVITNKMPRKLESYDMWQDTICVSVDIAST